MALYLGDYAGTLDLDRMSCICSNKEVRGVMDCRFSQKDLYSQLADLMIPPLPVCYLLPYPCPLRHSVGVVYTAKNTG
jgi:hypothetical protein